MRKKTVLFLCIFLILCITGTASYANSPMEENQNRPFYFSLVPKKNLDQQISNLTPMLQLLETKLQRPVKVIRPQSYQSVIEGVLSQTIDFAILGPASYARARALDKNVDAFASFAKKKGFITPGGSYYYCVLFSLKDYGFKSINGLRGKKIAFSDPASTSGSVIPNMEFPKHIGIPLDSFFGTQIYTGSHDRSIDSVIAGNVDAAFVSSFRVDEAIRKGKLKLDQADILWRSEPIHGDPLVFSGGVSRDTRKRIKEILLSNPSELHGMLSRMHMTEIVSVSNKDYRAIHEIVASQARQDK